MNKRERLARLLARDLPIVRNTPVIWRADHIYPCTGFWRIRRVEMDVMSWTATALDKNGNCVWNGGCWETITECLKAGRVELSTATDTISPAVTP